MMLTKKNSQYFAEYVEKKIYQKVTGIRLPCPNYSFSADEKKEMDSDAEKIAAYFSKSAVFKYTGRNTSNSVADFYSDGKDIELKYTKMSSGTYFNTSVEYCSLKLGFPSYQKYLLKFGVLDFLSSFFGQKVFENISPVSISESKLFRKDKMNYSRLKKLESKARKAYVEDFLKYLQENKLEKIFLSDMINKYSKGKAPDQIIIFNYENKDIKIFDMKDFESEGKLMLSGQNSLKNSTVRVTFAWQNGTGLNNPTIRVFLL